MRRLAPELWWDAGAPLYEAGKYAEAVEMWDGCRDLARNDSDFDPIRDEPGFRELIGS